jgi:hypothetical protein
MNESEGSLWREMEGRVSEEEEEAAMVESEREEGVRRIRGWWRRECMYGTVSVCERNGRCYNAQGVFRLAEFTKVDVRGGEENRQNRPTKIPFEPTRFAR